MKSAEFGAFIVNEKKVSLKLYNGPSYTNNYSKQQFQEGYTNLTGVTFDTQKITFTVGVYWISIEDYRVLMNLLHPYEVNMLSFSFEKTYGYQCKLSAIKDSTRYILGKESQSQNNSTHLNYSRIEGENGEGYRYYTELVLTFEVIGKQCAKELVPYQYLHSITPAVSENNIVWNTINGTDYEVQTYWPSDLDFPFELSLNNLVFKINNYSNTYHLKLEAVLQVDNQTAQKTTLFEIVLKNLIPMVNQEEEQEEEQDESLNSQEISLRYDSEQGLLYWALEDKQQILSLLSTNNNGQRIVSYLDTKRFLWSGRLDNPEVAESNYKYWLELSNICDYDEDEEEICGNIVTGSVMYKASRRTNVL